MSEYDTGRVVLDSEEAERIADTLEMHYEHTKESAHNITADDAAVDAMMIRDRGGIVPNPDLLSPNEQKSNGGK